MPSATMKAIINFFIKSRHTYFTRSIYTLKATLHCSQVMGRSEREPGKFTAPLGRVHSGVSLQEIDLLLLLKSVVG